MVYLPSKWLTYSCFYVNVVMNNPFVMNRCFTWHSIFSPNLLRYWEYVFTAHVLRFYYSSIFYSSYFSRIFFMLPPPDRLTWQTTHCVIYIQIKNAVNMFDREGKIQYLHIKKTKMNQQSFRFSCNSWYCLAMGKHWLIWTR